MYCPRRFALLEIDRDWLENPYVVMANIMHENVHSGKHSFSSKDRSVKSSVAVYNDLPEYNLYGILDCVEFVKQGGVTTVQVVEYKPTPPKDCAFHETDAIQVFAQKVCADYVWKCNSKAFLYYSKTKKRVELPFEVEYQKYDVALKALLSEMRTILDSGDVPKRKKRQKCSGCSIRDLCFPKDKPYSVRDAILSMK
jgi:CRISPR-associated exonuclease Cas4